MLPVESSPLTNQPVLLIFPPAATPEQPVLALATLAGSLHQHQIAVQAADLNLLAFHTLLEIAFIAQCCHKISNLLSGNQISDQKKNTAAAALAQADYIKKNLETAKQVLRDKHLFYIPEKRLAALHCLQAGLHLISQAYPGTNWAWGEFSCQYRPQYPAEVLAAAALPDSTPFTELFDHYIHHKILPSPPLLVGISICYFDQVIPAFRFLHQLKAVAPDIHCTIGGAVFTRLAQELPQLPELFSLVDSFIVHEGETALYGLAQALKQQTDLAAVPNLIYQKDDVIKTNPVQREQVAELPAPLFSVLPLNQYFLPETVLHLETSRGCYRRTCTFCNLPAIDFKRKHRPFPSEKIVDQLLKLCQQHQTSWVTFWDEAVPPTILRSLSEALLARQATIFWHAEICFDTSLDQELLTLMAQAGCRGLFFGLESAVPRIQKLMGKQLDLDKVSAMLSWCQELGIHTYVAWFVGFPGETRAEAEATCNFLLAHRKQVGYAWFPGSFVLRKHSLIAQYPDRFGVQIQKSKGATLALDFPHTRATGLSMDEAETVRKTFRKQFRKQGLGREPRFGPGYLLYQSHFQKTHPSFEPLDKQSVLLASMSNQARPQHAPAVQIEIIPAVIAGEQQELVCFMQTVTGVSLLIGHAQKTDFWLQHATGTSTLETLKKKFEKQFGKVPWIPSYAHLINKQFLIT